MFIHLEKNDSQTEWELYKRTAFNFNCKGRRDFEIIFWDSLKKCTLEEISKGDQSSREQIKK